MRIALDIVPAQHSVDSGYGRYMYALTSALIKEKSEHQFLVILGKNGNEKLIPRASNVEIAHCKAANQNVNQQWHAASIARKWKADLLHNMGAPASMLWNGKLILTIHDIASVRFPKLFPKRWSLFQKYAYIYLKKKNPMVVTVSEFSKREIAEHYHYSAERIRVVHPIPGLQPRSVSSEEIFAVRIKYKLPEKYFLYLGVIEPRKNLIRLVQAFEEYCASTQTETSLVIAGKIGWHARELQEAIAQSPVKQRIVLPGYIDDTDLAAMLASAHAFVYPSLYEGFGYPPLEALMVNTPVLTSNCASLPEAVGDAGLPVDPLDVHALAEGLHRIDTDITLRTQLIANGEKHRMNFTPEHSARKILTLYNEMQ
jgi:glycosyltransferase involved in cell wall biosynthesis